MGNSARIENIPTELSRRTRNDSRPNVSIEDWRMANRINLILGYHSPKEWKVAGVPNQNKILISHPSKAMLKIILSRLQPQAKIHCGRAGWFMCRKNHRRAIFNLRILNEKYIHVQSQNAYIDFKNASIKSDMKSYGQL